MPLVELIHDIKPHPGQIEVAKRMRYLLTGSKTLDTTKVQDQYSIRCIPQIHGAVRGALNYATEVVNIEANSVTDNPLIFFDKDDNTVVLSGETFMGNLLLWRWTLWEWQFARLLIFPIEE